MCRVWTRSSTSLMAMPTTAVARACAVSPRIVSLGHDISGTPKPFMAHTPRPWSHAEDTLLKHAVAELGDAPGIWKTIAQRIPGRSNKACRKVCLPCSAPAPPLTPCTEMAALAVAHRAQGASPPPPWRPLTRPQAPWTAEEDALLLSLHATHTPPRWSLIAKHIPGRTDDACSKRYREALDPQLKKDGWTDAEDATLLELTAQLGSKWTQVGHAMGRSGLGCRNRCVPHAPPCARLTPADGASWSASGAARRRRPTPPTRT